MHVVVVTLLVILKIHTLLSCSGYCLNLCHFISIVTIMLSVSISSVSVISSSPQAFKAKSDHKDPVSRKSASYASPQEVCTFITELGISKVLYMVLISRRRKK